MPNTVHLFDFDQTLTVNHTFKHTERALFPNASEADMYQLGKEEFDRNRKPGAESFFIHNDQQASAIATFHNNPSMVAGFLSRMLGDKEFTPVNTQYSGPYAVTTYQVKGSNTPVLVSWINASSADEFNGTIATLQQQNIHKNGQLSFLHQCMSNQNIIQPTTDIHYFDDSQANIIAAESLPFRVQRHQVSYDPTFDFTNIGPTANQVVQPLQSNPTPVAANAAMGQAQWPNNPNLASGYSFGVAQANPYQVPVTQGNFVQPMTNYVQPMAQTPEVNPASYYAIGQQANAYQAQAILAANAVQSTPTNFAQPMTGTAPVNPASYYAVGQQANAYQAQAISAANSVQPTATNFAQPATGTAPVNPASYYAIGQQANAYQAQAILAANSVQPTATNFAQPVTGTAPVNPASYYAIGQQANAYQAQAIWAANAVQPTPTNFVQPIAQTAPVDPASYYAIGQQANAYQAQAIWAASVHNQAIGVTPSSGIGYPQPSTSYPGNAQAQTNPEPKSNRASTAVLADNDEAHLYTIASPQSRGATNNATPKSTPQENSEAHLYTMASPQSRGATNNATPKPAPQENSEAHLYTMASPQSRGATNNATPKPVSQDNSEAHLYTMATPQSRDAVNQAVPTSKTQNVTGTPSQASPNPYMSNKVSVHPETQKQDANLSQAATTTQSSSKREKINLSDSAKRRIATQILASLHPKLKSDWKENSANNQLFSPPYDKQTAELVMSELKAQLAVENDGISLYESTTAPGQWRVKIEGQVLEDKIFNSPALAGSVTSIYPTHLEDRMPALMTDTVLPELFSGSKFQYPHIGSGLVSESSICPVQPGLTSIQAGQKKLESVFNREGELAEASKHLTLYNASSRGRYYYSDENEGSGCGLHISDPNALVNSSPTVQVALGKAFAAQFNFGKQQQAVQSATTQNKADTQNHAMGPIGTPSQTQSQTHVMWTPPNPQPATQSQTHAMGGARGASSQSESQTHAMGGARGVSSQSESQTHAIGGARGVSSQSKSQTHAMGGARGVSSPINAMESMNTSSHTPSQTHGTSRQGPSHSQPSSSNFDMSKQGPTTQSTPIRGMNREGPTQSQTSFPNPAMGPIGTASHTPSETHSKAAIGHTNQTKSHAQVTQKQSATPPQVKATGAVATQANHSDVSLKNPSSIKTKAPTNAASRQITQNMKEQLQQTKKTVSTNGKEASQGKISQLLGELEQHIKGLQSSWNPFMRSPERKISALGELKTLLQDPTNHGKQVGEVLNTWLEKNQNVINQHRLKFKAEEREEKTNTAQFIENLKNAYGTEEVKSEEQISCNMGSQ
ncbi:hypothetical protein Ljor_0215 [Legionella jordanis]|uniref:Uncharacterized protein n=1 Tax=Legionella jordanis TaxID=456 RepID=A0A0W0VFU7_9GAMM|nr:hypothetical protein [Legionella jordanis]KTD18992.1 hypothetical protein Ljor_0215 [Legionella jordanis]